MAKSSHITNDQEKNLQVKTCHTLWGCLLPPKKCNVYKCCYGSKENLCIDKKKIVMATAPPYQRFYLNEYKCKWERDVDISTLTWSVF